MSADILHFFGAMEAPNRIRELRLAKGWSQQRLADEINVSKPTISDLERGNMQLTVEYMRRLALALGCAPAEIMAREDNPFLLSTEEKNIIRRMRAAESDQRDQLRQLADVVIPWKGAPSESDAA